MEDVFPWMLLKTYSAGHLWKTASAIGGIGDKPRGHRTYIERLMYVQFTSCLYGEVCRDLKKVLGTFFTILVKGFHESYRFPRLPLFSRWPLFSLCGYEHLLIANFEIIADMFSILKSTRICNLHLGHLTRRYSSGLCKFQNRICTASGNVLGTMHKVCEIFWNFLVKFFIYILWL